jgi:transposase
MARGIKKVEDRKQVRNVRISIRLNEYELEQVMLHLDLEQDKRSISTFVRDLVIDYTKPKES